MSKHNSANSRKYKQKLTHKQKTILKNWREPGTMRMVEQRIKQQHNQIIFNTTICGYMEKFKELGLLEFVKSDVCQFSGFRADYFRATPKGLINGLI